MAPNPIILRYDFGNLCIKGLRRLMASCTRQKCNKNVYHRRLSSNVMSRWSMLVN